MDYKEFIKDNPKGLWFKRKWYGWGWTPVRWQGWVATLIYIALLLISALRINENSGIREVLIQFALPAAILTFLFILLAYKKGESPRWQWGPPEDDK